MESLLESGLVGLLLGVGLGALFVLCAVSFPGLVARAQQNAEQLPVRCFLAGLVNCVFFSLLAAAFTAGGPLFHLIAAAIATILLSFVAVGLTVVAGLVGERLRPADPRPLRRLLAGALTLELAAVVPVVGWVMVPALAGLTGYGATIIALIWRRRPQ